MQADELFGMAHRQRTQEGLIEKREDCGVGAYAQRQRKHRDNREGWRLAHLPQAQSNFVQDRSHYFLISWSTGYSVRSAFMGSIEAARRAGNHAANPAVEMSTTTAPTALMGSKGDTPNSRLFITRTTKKAPTAPIRTPPTAIMALSRMTMPKMRFRSAPKATRSANSLVRSPTE